VPPLLSKCTAHILGCLLPCSVCVCVCMVAGCGLQPVQKPRSRRLVTEDSEHSEQDADYDDDDAVMPCVAVHVHRSRQC